MFRTALLTIALLAVVDWQAVVGAPCDENPNGCEASFKCQPKVDYTDPQSVCYNYKCTTAIQNHIKEEFNAAFTYLAMGAYFAQEKVNRPGLAKFLLGAASEERSHAILMLDYLNKRGITLKADNSNYNYNFTQAQSAADIYAKLEELKGDVEYKDVLTIALNMEIKVTDLIYNVIEQCDKDFHGADVFTNPILDEQHDGVRQLQGAIKAFNNLAEGSKQGALKQYAEYTFDMMLLKGELMAGH